MSLKTWLKIAYIMSAEEAAKGTLVDAIEHSFLKWRHLDKKTIDLHNVYQDGPALGCSNPISYFIVDGNSCAMCHKVDGNCSKCIGREANGHTCSYISKENSSPYAAWCQTGDNKPMIEWLEKALIYAKNERQGRGI